MDHGSSTFTHLVNFKFTDYGTTDCGSTTFTHSITFKFTDSDYKTMDHSSNTFTHKFLSTDCGLWTAVAVHLIEKFVAGYSEVALTSF